MIETQLSSTTYKLVLLAGTVVKARGSLTWEEAEERPRVWEVGHRNFYIQQLR